MNQKILTLVTLGVVLAGAVGINEFIIRNSDNEQNRELASFGERFEPEQIKWEQELAKTIAAQSDEKNKVGAKPSFNERLLFEALEGRYTAVVSEGKVLKIRLSNNQKPLAVDTDSMLSKYSEVFKGAKNFKKFTVSTNIESVELQNSEGRAVGSVTIQRNDEGLVTEIYIE